MEEIVIVCCCNQQENNCIKVSIKSPLTKKHSKPTQVYFHTQEKSKYSFSCLMWKNVLRNTPWLQMSGTREQRVKSINSVQNSVCLEFGFTCYAWRLRFLSEQYTVVHLYINLSFPPPFVHLAIARTSEDIHIGLEFNFLWIQLLFS